MSAATASPAGQQDRPRDTLKYSDLSPQMIAILRLDASLSNTYGDTRSSKLLEGYEEWRKGITPQMREMLARRQAGCVR